MNKPQHPHGGPPGQTGKHPLGGPPGQADKPPAGPTPKAARAAVAVAAANLDFVWIMARGVSGIGYPGPAADGSVRVLPCGSWGWVDDTITAALVASGSVIVQPEGPVVIDFAADGCLPATTGVTAGTPGAFIPATAVPGSLAGLQAMGALGETTAWTVGQNVVLGDATLAHWNGTAWAAGAAT